MICPLCEGEYITVTEYDENDQPIKYNCHNCGNNLDFDNDDAKDLIFPIERI